MASLQRFSVQGHSYWRIVESRRVNGRPTIRVVAYLGKADNLLARLRGAETLTLRSVSHGAVAAMAALARELDVAGTIDRHLQASGRRSRKRLPRDVRLAPLRNDGLSVGQSLLLASIGRACHATSKRGFATWAKTTTLGDLFGVDPERLTSQHFWDQMDQLPVDSHRPHRAGDRRPGHRALRRPPRHPALRRDELLHLHRLDEHPRRAARPGSQQAEASRPAAARSRAPLHAP